jgi:hypothetical protein
MHLDDLETESPMRLQAERIVSGGIETQTIKPQARP